MCEQTEECGNTPRKVHGLQDSGRNPFVTGESIPSFLGFINSTLHVSGFLKIGLNWSPLKPCPHGQISSVPTVDKGNLAG